MRWLDERRVVVLIEPNEDYIQRPLTLSTQEEILDWQIDIEISLYRALEGVYRTTSAFYWKYGSERYHRGHPFDQEGIDQMFGGMFGLMELYDRRLQDVRFDGLFIFVYFD